MATHQDLDAFRETFLASGSHWEDIESQFSRGDLCFLGLVDGRLCHFMWLTLGSSPITALGVTIVIGRGEGLVYSAYTSPAMRGLAIQPAVANFMIKHEQSLGLARHFYYVLGDNEAGRKIVSGRHAAAPAVASRVVMCIHFPLFRGVLLRGLDTPGRPLLEVPPQPGVRRLGPLGVWVSGPGVNLQAL